MGSSIFSGLFGRPQAQQGQQTSSGQAQLGQMMTQCNHQQQQMAQNIAITQGMLGAANITVPQPPSISSDQAEEMRLEYLDEKRTQFLKNPEHHREAFLNELRAKAVKDSMQESNFFGMNRVSTQGGLSGWFVPAGQGLHYSATQQIPVVTLTQYEEWHAGEIIDKVVLGNDE